MSIARFLAGLLATLALVASVLFPGYDGFEAQLSQPPGSERLRGEVLRLADGDSFRMQTADGSEVEVRMHGIDAPERAQPHGRRAAQALEAYLRGKPLEIEIIEEDDYGRQVGVVYVGGENINLAMVRAGHAWWYEYYAADNRALAEAHREAARRRLGLWAASEAPLAPWDWRRRQR